MTQPQFPGAILAQLHDHSAPGSRGAKNLVVLHITDGSTAAGAIATFAASTAPHRTSAHFVIERDGRVFQLLPIEDTAWHASQVNSRSIGIEHVAMTQQMADALNRRHSVSTYQALGITDAQYDASARLVAWCCIALRIPADRAHIKGHNEASPQDGHTGCPAPTLDVDRVAALAAQQVPLSY